MLALLVGGLLGGPVGAIGAMSVTVVLFNGVLIVSVMRRLKGDGEHGRYAAVEWQR